MIGVYPRWRSQKQFARGATNPSNPETTLGKKMLRWVNFGRSFLCGNTGIANAAWITSARPPARGGCVGLLSGFGDGDVFDMNTTQTRDFENVVEHPLVGDVIEIQEGGVENMLRVLAVVEDWVWFKEYGSSCRPSLPMGKWRTRLRSAVNQRVVSFQ